ncbi:hypothetical protein [Neorhodopirellula pilleata]|uniref:Uncharacterized protein n=1 Tax=Neorhodopirellula pilleata TaxID=2714738 RepID=A0A5C6AWS4_9BACT|nr:hypothetical protein [Neorhodopirellula pilleata]TWU04088.1 hypothetical protein Pla100_10240 [Neorhodopirellula pilleata]
MKYLVLIGIVFVLGCGGSNDTTIVPNDMSPEQVQAEIEANNAIESAPASGGGV